MPIRSYSPDTFRILSSVGWTPQQDREWLAAARGHTRTLRQAARGRQTPDQEVGTPEQPRSYPIERPLVNEPVHPAKTNLVELLTYIEEKRESWNMNEGDYLKITGMMKLVYDSV